MRFLSRHLPVLLIVSASVLAYGLLIPWLGLYTDDWTFLYAYHHFGSAGLFDYFRDHRPVWGVTYQAVMPLLGTHAWVWHVYGLLCRIAASLAFYFFVRFSWPKKERMALAAGLFFAIYPGYVLQPLSLVMGQVFVVFAVFLASLVCTLLAVRKPQKRVQFTILALLGSAFNVLAMEYFLPLELLRLPLIFLAIDEAQPAKERVRQSMRTWLPYLILLIVVVVWRAFFYTAQTTFYNLVLIDELKSQPVHAVIELIKTFGVSLYQAGLIAWARPVIELVKGALQPTRTDFIVWAITLASFLGLGALLLKSKAGKVSGEPRPRADGSVLWFSLFALAIAGLPFYLTGLPVESIGFNSRFTLPFMLGASLLLAFLADQIKVRGWFAGLTAFVVATSVGTHFFTANLYRHDTLQNTQTLYELIWRVPGMKAGTAIVSNDGSPYYTDGTLSAQLNLIYPQQTGLSSTYAWVWPRELVALTSDPVLPGKDFTESLYAFPFEGNTSDVIAVQIRPNGCLRVVTEDSYMVNPTLNLHGIHKLTNLSLIETGAQPPVIELPAFGREPAHEWCYYFEKADLALQAGDYEAIAGYYREVQAKGFGALKSVEWFPFIEGLALGGRVDDARQITQQVMQSDGAKEGFAAAICKVWARVEKAHTSAEVTGELTSLGCR